MAENANIAENNEAVPSSAIPVQITDNSAEITTPKLCEISECDSSITPTEENICSHLGNNDQSAIPDLHTEIKTEEEQLESSIQHENESKDIHIQETETEEQDCNNILGSSVNSVLLLDLHKPEELMEAEYREQGDSIAEADNKCLMKHTESITRQDGEEILITDASAENINNKYDIENGEEPFFDEQENEPRDSLSPSPSDSNLESAEEQPFFGNRPDISRHSYSRYDTVSYRKIRKGNTKQRIDEFESMMNI
ncbi:ermin [Bombina bombina]|uniref:ermin n=1 Tax=Bombina bombina TaxID=8345 RepID=UPI00235AB93A|nr:ermin [Bombina bombina]